MRAKPKHSDSDLNPACAVDAVIMMAGNNNPLLFVGIILVVLITAGLTYYVAKSGELPPQNQTNGTGGPTITVRGEAAKTVRPDLLTLGLSIESYGANTSSAQAQSALDTAAVKAALLAAGVSASEIQTSSYYTYAVYNESCRSGCYDPYYYDYSYDYKYVEDASGGAYETEAVPAAGEADAGIAYPDMYPMPYPDRCKKCEITGYRTVHSLMIKSNGTASGGDFASAAVAASNSTRVDYVYFSLKDETRVKLESDLQASAAANAKSKAESIATGLGAKLGKVVSVSTDYYPYYPVYAYDRAGSYDAEMAPTEIFPTDSTYSGQITVVYALEQ